MNPIKNDLFLRALACLPVERTPVWMMRQAGRYLPEYRTTRARAGGFLDLCRTPELCCEVALQPMTRFNLDAAILFSDILTVPDAMGLELSFVEGEGPVFGKPVTRVDQIDQLAVPDPETELRYVMDALRTTRAALDGSVPIIGFSGSPWTLATYAVEGRGGHDFSTVKALALNEPAAMERLLSTFTAAVESYLLAQIAAGADAVMIFDTWGGVLSPAAYLRLSLGPMRSIVSGLKRHAPEVPVILFTKNGGAHLRDLAESGCDALGVDWTTDLDHAWSATQGRVALQGNLDPVTLFAKPEVIRSEVARVLESYGPGPGHVFNLGHGILPGTPPEHVAAMVEAVRELSPVYNKPLL